MQWPPRSGRMIDVPEVDRGAWFILSEAHEIAFSRAKDLSSTASPRTSAIDPDSSRREGRRIRSIHIDRFVVLVFHNMEVALPSAPLGRRGQLRHRVLEVVRIILHEVLWCDIRRLASRRGTSSSTCRIRQRALRPERNRAHCNAAAVSVSAFAVSRRSRPSLRWPPSNNMRLLSRLMVIMVSTCSW